MNVATNVPYKEEVEENGIKYPFEVIMLKSHAWFSSMNTL